MKTNPLRRNFLKLATLGTVGLLLSASLRTLAGAFQNNTKVYNVYIGTYTTGKSEGIYLYQLNALTGELTHVNTTKGVSNPSFLTLDAKALSVGCQ